jgi:hypothetical protein
VQTNFVLPAGSRHRFHGPVAASEFTGSWSLVLGRPGNTATLPLNLRPAAPGEIGPLTEEVRCPLPASPRLFAPVRSGRWILMFAPALRELVCLSANRSSPTGRLKIVPLN